MTTLKTSGHAGLSACAVAFAVACSSGGGSAPKNPAERDGSTLTPDAQRSAGGASTGGASTGTGSGSSPSKPGSSGGVPNTGTSLDSGKTHDAGDVDSADDAGGAPACGGTVLGEGPLTTTTQHLDIGVHDPSMIWDGHRYYLFATGGTLGVRSSADLITWAGAGNIFTSIPAWITAALGSNPGSLWAPDVSYFEGQYHVYYAGSTFGSNHSVVGLATTPSLASPAWADQGLIVQSGSGDFNAIDPNVSFDASCTPWLAFGSFWSGIKLRKLDPKTGQPASDDSTVYSLASRNGGAIEAASIISHSGFYYLFVSFDACCNGTSSTYRTMVGRANDITGPYADKAGKDMMQGAAEQLLASAGRYIGPGGGTAWQDGRRYLYAYHYYDGQANGASKLQIRPITFDTNDWVVLGDPLFP